MKAIEVISIPVTDQQKAKEFYLKLGFSMIAEAHFGNGEKWVQLGFPNESTTITLVNWWPFQETKMRAGSLHAVFVETDDLEKEMKELKAKGIEIGVLSTNGIEPGKIDDTALGKFAHVIDPDGNALVIHQNK